MHFLSDAVRTQALKQLAIVVADLSPCFVDEEHGLKYGNFRLPTFINIRDVLPDNLFSVLVLSFFMSLSKGCSFDIVFGGRNFTMTNSNLTSGRWAGHLLSNDEILRFCSLFLHLSFLTNVRITPTSSMHFCLLSIVLIVCLPIFIHTGVKFYHLHKAIKKAARFPSETLTMNILKVHSDRRVVLRRPAG